MSTGAYIVWKREGGRLVATEIVEDKTFAAGVISKLKQLWKRKHT